MSAPLQQVEVGGATPYRIDIAPALLDDGALLASQLRGRHALIVSDSQVAPLYAQRVQAALAAVRPDARIALHVFDAGEASKTLANFSGVIDALAALGATRDACVYALGGGVVGDLAGFAAACWMRGTSGGSRAGCWCCRTRCWPSITRRGAAGRSRTRRRWAMATFASRWGWA